MNNKISPACKSCQYYTYVEGDAHSPDGEYMPQVIYRCCGYEGRCSLTKIEVEKEEPKEAEKGKVFNITLYEKYKDNLEHYGFFIPEYALVEGNKFRFFLTESSQTIELTLSGKEELKASYEIEGYGNLRKRYF